MNEHFTDLQVAALQTQSASTSETFDLLEHAATCRQCRQRIVTDQQMNLEMASVARSLSGVPAHLTLEEITGFVEGVLPTHDRTRVTGHLADCEICASDVHQLEQMAGQSLPAQAPAQPFRDWFRTLLNVPRLTFATALLLVVSFSGWLLLRHSAPTIQTAKQQNESRPSPPQPPLAADVSSLPVPPHLAPHPSTLAFALTPGLVRNDSEQTLLALPQETTTVRLTLKSRTELLPGRYVVSIAQASVPHGHVFTKALFYRIKPSRITFDVPTTSLRPGRYLLTLSASWSGATEQLDDYPFRVTR